MATKQTVRVDGLRELAKAMNNLSQDLEKKISRQASAAAAKVVQKAAKVKVPVRTGHLKNNIIIKKLGRSDSKLTSEHIVTIRKRRTKKQKAAGEGSAFYGLFVEFGTVKQPAQPFLRPAFDQTKGQALDAMVDKLKVRIDQAQRTGK